MKLLAAAVQLLLAAVTAWQAHQTKRAQREFRDDADYIRNDPAGYARERFGVSDDATPAASLSTDPTDGARDNRNSDGNYHASAGLRGAVDLPPRARAMPTDNQLTESKKWYQSKGIIGGIVALLSAALTLAGVTLSADEQVQLTDLLIALGGVVGGLLAIIGRKRATKKVA